MAVAQCQNKQQTPPQHEESVEIQKKSAQVSIIVIHPVVLFDNNSVPSLMPSRPAKPQQATPSQGYKQVPAGNGGPGTHAMGFCTPLPDEQQSSFHQKFPQDSPWALQERANSPDSKGVARAVPKRSNVAV